MGADTGYCGMVADTRPLDHRLSKRKDGSESRKYEQYHIASNRSCFAASATNLLRNSMAAALVPRTSPGFTVIRFWRRRFALRGDRWTRGRSVRGPEGVAGGRFRDPLITRPLVLRGSASLRFLEGRREGAPSNWSLSQPPIGSGVGVLGRSVIVPVDRLFASQDK